MRNIIQNMDTLKKERVREFIELIEQNTPKELKESEFKFQNEHNRKPRAKELKVNVNIGYMRDGPPLDEEELKIREESVSAQIERKLKEKFSIEEIHELICHVITSKEIRNEIPAYIILILYYLGERMERDHRIFDAMCKAMLEFADIPWDDDSASSFFKKHASSRDVVFFGIKLLKSPNYEHRMIGDLLIYTSGGPDLDQLNLVLEAYKIAYNFELNEKTKSPPDFYDGKRVCEFGIREYTEELNKAKKISKND